MGEQEFWHYIELAWSMAHAEQQSGSISDTHTKVERLPRSAATRSHMVHHLSKLLSALQPKQLLEFEQHSLRLTAELGIDTAETTHLPDAIVFGEARYLEALALTPRHSN